jgi:hypothetical protein
MIYFLFYLMGVAQDFLITLNLRLIGQEKRQWAALLSFFNTAIGLLVIFKILSSLDQVGSIRKILCYSAGVGTGTFLAITLKLTSKKRNNMDAQNQTASVAQATSSKPEGKPLTQEQMLEEIYKVAKQTRSFMKWQLYITIILIVIPLLATIFLIPSALKGLSTYTGSLQDLQGLQQ